MESFFNLVFSNPIPFLVVSLPLLYLVIRDIVRWRLNKKELELSRKRLIETEKTVEELYRKLNANRSALIQSLKDLNDKYPSLDLDSEQDPPLETFDDEESSTPAQ